MDAICHNIIHSARLRPTWNVLNRAIDFRLGNEYFPLITVFLRSVGLDNSSKWPFGRSPFKYVAANVGPVKMIEDKANKSEIKTYHSLLLKECWHRPWSKPRLVIIGLTSVVSLLDPKVTSISGLRIPVSTHLTEIAPILPITCTSCVGGCSGLSEFVSSMDLFS